MELFLFKRNRAIGCSRSLTPTRLAESEVVGVARCGGDGAVTLSRQAVPLAIVLAGNAVDYEEFCVFL